MCSSDLISVGLISLLIKGLTLGVDFKGGRSYVVRFVEPVPQEEIQSKLVATLGNAEVKTFGSENQLKITSNYKVDDTSTSVDDEIHQILYSGLSEYIGDITIDDFVNGNEDKQIGIMSSFGVGPTIADDIKKNSFLSIPT